MSGAMDGAMSDKREVAVTIQSDADGERVVLRASGVLYRKGDSVYVRYEERDEQLGVSMVTVKAAGPEVRLTRRGAVDSELVFVAGAERRGHYRSAQLLMPLRVVCSRADVQLDRSGVLERIAVAYTLHSDDALLGRYRVTFLIASPT